MEARRELLLKVISRDRPHWWSRNGGVVTMAMPQRDNVIEEIKRLDALLEFAVVHDDEEETERIR